MSKKDKWQERRRDYDDDEWESDNHDSKRYDHKKFSIRERRRDKYQKRDGYLDDKEYSS